jgi:hypothetical protein
VLYIVKNTCFHALHYVIFSTLCHFLSVGSIYIYAQPFATKKMAGAVLLHICIRELTRSNLG